MRSVGDFLTILTYLPVLIPALALVVAVVWLGLTASSRTPSGQQAP